MDSISNKIIPETSIIIRTKNEEKWLGKVLERLSEQNYRDFEIIIVDSGSTDKTLEIIKNFDIKLFQIKSEEFSYPFALNYGIGKSQAREYLVFLSGHSLPISKNWLKDGIKDFTDEKIMGVYGFVWALPDASFWEKLIFNKYLCIIRHLFKKKKVIRKRKMGVLGFTNAIVRKKLWNERCFNEAFGAGGEDGEWAAFWFERGYAVVKDEKFTVYHSHGLRFQKLLKQWKYWKSLGSPLPFKFPQFR